MDPCHKVFISSSCEKSFCPDFDSNDRISSQFCTCHDSWAVMTCAKLWPDSIIIFQVKATWVLTRFGLWAHVSFVQWAPDPWGIPQGSQSGRGVSRRVRRGQDVVHCRCIHNSRSGAGTTVLRVQELCYSVLSLKQKVREFFLSKISLEFPFQRIQTHWGLNKIANILKMASFKMQACFQENFLFIFIWILFKFVSKGFRWIYDNIFISKSFHSGVQIDNSSCLNRGWCLIEPIMTYWWLGPQKKITVYCWKFFYNFKKCTWNVIWMMVFRPQWVK